MAIPFFSLHYICILVLSACSILANAQTNNSTIILGSSLLASDKPSSWQSPSGEFAFGFLHLQDRDLFLLSIWLDKIPDKTIVWYANGDNLAPRDSKIELSNDGQIMLTGPEGQVIWKPEPAANGVTHATLLDTGNFVLANANSGYVWESFNHPMDTILPTQTMEIGGFLSSRLSANNYSKGRFQLRLLVGGDLILNPIALPTDFAYGAYYHSNTSDDLNNMNAGVRVVFNESGYINVVRRNGNIVSLNTGNVVSTKDHYLRATLDFDGLFTLYAHPRAPRNGTWVQSWFIVWFEPNDICFAVTGDNGSGACGFNSICTLDSNGRPTCECLPGFSLVNPNDKYSDCKQDKVQRCQVGGLKPEEVYEMVEVPHTYWPTASNYEIFPLAIEGDCSSACFNDCNCVIAVVKEGKCWKKKLPVPNGRVQQDIYGKALIKVPKVDNSSGGPLSPNSDSRKKDHSTLNLVISLLLGVSVFVNFLFAAGIPLALFLVYQKKHNVTRETSIMETNLHRFSYKDLIDATNGFTEQLGRGAFGTVYKGVISSSVAKDTVAVKRLEKLAQDGEKEFRTEVATIAKTHHKNLVRLVGFCDEGSHRLLVYEFMSNGTLSSYVFGILRPDWNKRIQMAYGIARGLMYLHEECSTQIIHCDIKPQNILLDDSLTAKISDFGLAKLLMSDQTKTHTAIRGTRGYVAPEWFRSIPITAKVDVYSYGVMLLEIICCRKNVAVEMENEGEEILTDWAYDCYKRRKLYKLVETDEEAREDMRRLERLVMVAIWCIQEDPSLRPFMKNVIQMLDGVVEVPEPPNPCPFNLSV